MGFLGVDGWTQSSRSASQLFGKQQFLGSFEDEEEVWTTQTSCFVETLFLCIENIPKKTTDKNIQGDVFFFWWYRFFLCWRLIFVILKMAVSQKDQIENGGWRPVSIGFPYESLDLHAHHRAPRRPAPSIALPASPARTRFGKPWTPLWKHDSTMSMSLKRCSLVTSFDSFESWNVISDSFLEARLQ